MEELHSPEKALGKNFEELSLIYEFWRIPDFVDHEKYESKFMKKMSHLSKIGHFFFHFAKRSVPKIQLNFGAKIHTQSGIF